MAPSGDDLVAKSHSPEGPCVHLPQPFTPRAVLGTTETPVAAVLDAPMTTDGVGEPLHAHPEAADVRADLGRLIPVADALGHHHPDRLQARPRLQPRQAL